MFESQKQSECYIIIITELWVISDPKFNFLDYSHSGIGIYRIVLHGIEIRYRVRVLLLKTKYYYHSMYKIIVPVCNLLWSMEDYRQTV